MNELEEAWTGAQAPGDGEVLAAVPREAITQPYLLTLFSVPFYLDAGGRRYLDALWAKDLAEHAVYIKHLSLAAPAIRGPIPPHAVAMDTVDALKQIRCVDLPPAASFIAALRALPRTWRILWGACARAQLVHSSIASWPLPEAWVLAPILLLQRRLHYINVESAPWRPVPGERIGLLRRLRSRVTERLNRSCVGAADISTFTQEEYRHSLLRRHGARGRVIEASWIDAGNILSQERLDAALQQRALNPALRMVFVGRLTPSKGILLLLDVMAKLVAGGQPVELDIVGDGPLATTCAARLQGDPALAKAVRLLGPVPYDHAFFELLSTRELLVVPTLSDEQPRIVFDAYSQGVPVLASSTAGLRQCVQADVTGLLFDAGDTQALAAAILDAVRRRPEIARMAPACIRRARAYTHQEMHRQRWQLLVSTFPELCRP